MKAKDIIKFVKSIKKDWNTNDPYTIAAHYGINVEFTTTCMKGFTAHTIKMDDYPTFISINDAYTDFSKKLLCAHELGHALLHADCINHFAITNKNVITNVEQEANLFAIALLADESTLATLDVPLESMNNYLLKTIMDYNLTMK